MTTTDKFLNGKIIIKQTENGYRAGIDAVLLAASIKPKPGEKILEVGTGVGTVMLCLLSRYPSIHVRGIEIQHEMVKLCRENIQCNHMEERAEVFQANIADPPDFITPNSYDHVVTNPPFHNYGDLAVNNLDSKSIARHVSDITLHDWITSCLRLVKPRGFFTIIHRTNYINDIMAALKPKTGQIKVYPLWPSADKPAKMVIIQARKSVKTGCSILPGLIIHEPNGSYTSKAEAIFRGNDVIEL